MNTHQHDHEGIHESFAFDVNRRYRHRQRRFSDIHPNIAKILIQQFIEAESRSKIIGSKIKLVGFMSEIFFDQEEET